VLRHRRATPATCRSHSKGMRSFFRPAKNSAKTTRECSGIFRSTAIVGSPMQKEKEAKEWRLVEYFVSYYFVNLYQLIAAIGVWQNGHSVSSRFPRYVIVRRSSGIWAEICFPDVFQKSIRFVIMIGA